MFFLRPLYCVGRNVCLFNLLQHTEVGRSNYESFFSPLPASWVCSGSLTGLGVPGAGAQDWLPVQLLRIFLEILPVLIGGTDADRRKAGSRYLQFPQGKCPCQSWWAAQQLSCSQWFPGELFPRWNVIVDAVVLGSQFHVHTEERQQ